MAALSYLGTQFNKQEIADIADRLDRIAKTKRDYVVSASAVQFSIDEKLAASIPGVGRKVFTVGNETFTDFREAEDASDRTGLRLEVAKADENQLELTATASAQLSDKLGIPKKFLDRLVGEECLQPLAIENLSTLAKHGNQRWLVRCLEGRIRAVLSDRYQILDNEDLFLVSAETFQKCGAEFWKARVSDDRFDCLAVSKHISAEVRTDRPIDGWRWKGDEGDTHNAAIMVSNSETGRGGLNVSPAIFRGVCQNFCTWGEVIRTVHLGKRHDEDGVVYRADTLAAEAETVWLKLRDLIETTFDPVRFEAYIDKLNHITQQVLPDETVAVAKVSAHYRLSEDRRKAILKGLILSQDATRYGLVQAVTDEAHSVDESDPETAAMLESIGGDLVEMKDADFANLVTA